MLSTRFISTHAVIGIGALLGALLLLIVAMPDPWPEVSRLSQVLGLRAWIGWGASACLAGLVVALTLAGATNNQRRCEEIAGASVILALVASTGPGVMAVYSPGDNPAFLTRAPWFALAMLNIGFGFLLATGSLVWARTIRDRKTRSAA